MHIVTIDRAASKMWLNEDSRNFDNLSPPSSELSWIHTWHPLRQYVKCDQQNAGCCLQALSHSQPCTACNSSLLCACHQPHWSHRLMLPHLGSAPAACHSLLHWLLPFQPGSAAPSPPEAGSPVTRLLSQGLHLVACLLHITHQHISRQHHKYTGQTAVSTAAR